MTLVDLDRLVIRCGEQDAGLGTGSLPAAEEGEHHKRTEVLVGDVRELGFIGKAQAHV